MIRVLGVSGSPHRHGNTETLLDAFLEGARGAGAEVEKVVLSTLAYASCRGCNACHRTGACVLKDDAGPLLERMAAAGAIEERVEQDLGVPVPVRAARDTEHPDHDASRSRRVATASCPSATALVRAVGWRSTAPGSSTLLTSR